MPCESQRTYAEIGCRVYVTDGVINEQRLGGADVRLTQRREKEIRLRFVDAYHAGVHNNVKRN